MNLSTRRHPLTALLMAVVMIITSMPIGLAHAGMVSTKTIIDQQAPAPAASDQVAGDRERIRDLFARDDVRTEMIALGIAPAEAEARIAALTDDEVAEIAGRLDQLPAGEGVGTIGIVLVALFVAFGVTVLMDAIGIINLYPFVCGPGQCNAQAQNFSAVEPAAAPSEFDRFETDDRRRAFRRDRFEDRAFRRDNRRFDSSEYYDPNPYAEPQTRSRNYFEERSGTQRFVR